MTDREIEEHEERCERAGCGHPAVYRFGSNVLLGWCALCRADAFGGEAAESVERAAGDANERERLRATVAAADEMAAELAQVKREAEARLAELAGADEEAESDERVLH